MDAQKLAESTSEHMFDNDRASQTLGMVLEEIRPGYARMSMRIRRDMLNGHEICHGGFIEATQKCAIIQTFNKLLPNGFIFFHGQ